MKKFPSKNRMREVKVLNSWDIADLTDQKVYVDWIPQQTGRGYRCARYQVIHLGFNTDPKAHWMDNGQKTFDVYGGDEKKAALAKAMTWANQIFGAREWVRDPWGSYQDPSAVEKVKALVKEFKAKHPVTK